MFSTIFLIVALKGRNKITQTKLKCGTLIMSCGMREEAYNLGIMFTPLLFPFKTTVHPNKWTNSSYYSPPPPQHHLSRSAMEGLTLSSCSSMFTFILFTVFNRSKPYLICSSSNWSRSCPPRPKKLCIFHLHQ